jgi:hypothetical protein
MKKTICVLFVLFIIISRGNGNEPLHSNYSLKEKAKSQYRDTVPCIEPSATYYWYYVKPIFNEKSNTNKIRVLSKTPKSGSTSVYEKDVWRNMQGGQQIVIGPFNTINDAQNSILYYEIAALQSDSLIHSSNKELYWYKFTYNRTKKPYRFDLRSDYKLSKGNSSEFIQELKNSIQKNILLIGPWSDNKFFEDVRPKPRQSHDFEGK